MPVVRVPAAAVLALWSLAAPSYAQRILTGTDTPNPPQVKEFDGITLAQIHSFFAFTPSFTGGVRVAMGNINSDGVPDIVAATGPGGGQVAAFDGATLASLGSFLPFGAGYTGGVFVGMGDVTGDGRPDIVVGADAGGSPQVSVFRNPDWMQVQSFLAFPPGFTGGVRVAAGDVDGDAKSDIFAAAGAGGSPEVKVFSGANGSVLHDFLVFSPGFAGGVFVAAGDVNGDNRADIVAGAGSGGAPQVSIFNGVTEALVTSFLAFDPGFTGGVTVGSGRVNADNVSDILAGAGTAGNSLVRAFDGSSFAQFQSFNAYATPYTGQVFVAAPGIPPATPVELQAFSIE